MAMFHGSRGGAALPRPEKRWRPDEIPAGASEPVQQPTVPMVTTSCAQSHSLSMEPGVESSRYAVHVMRPPRPAYPTVPQPQQPFAGVAGSQPYRPAVSSVALASGPHSASDESWQAPSARKKARLDPPDVSSVFNSLASVPPSSGSVSLKQLSAAAAAAVVHSTPAVSFTSAPMAHSAPAPAEVDWASVSPLRLPEGMKEHIAEYIEQIHGATNPLDHTVRILHSRVVQKSYGSEKRFFCPPPNVSITEPEDSSHPREPVVGVGITDGPDARFDSQVDVERTADGCIARARFLHISDVDKRKHFRVRVKVLVNGSQELGVFQSAPIKVISKPSKRKFSMSNLDMRIDTGEVVALFNRVRSQPGSTRFLGSSASAFSLSTTRWGTFEIIRRSPASKSAVHHNTSSDFVHYNMTVVLKSRESGLLSAEYVIRKAERNTVNTAESDPVSQLQKVAFLIKGSDRMYLASQDGDVTVRQSKLTANGTEVLFDNCIWTIGSAEIQAHALCVRYQVPSVAGAFLGQLAQPVVSFIRHRGDVVELFGSEFHSQLEVWFEKVQSITACRGADLIQCKPPGAEDFVTADGTPRARPFSVHVLLLRSDGVIYRTNYTYTYPALAAKVEDEPTAADHAQSKLSDSASTSEEATSAPAPAESAAPAQGDGDRSVGGQART